MQREEKKYTKFKRWKWWTTIKAILLLRAVIVKFKSPFIRLQKTWKFWILFCPTLPFPAQKQTPVLFAYNNVSEEQIYIDKAPKKVSSYFVFLASISLCLAVFCYYYFFFSGPGRNNANLNRKNRNNFWKQCSILSNVELFIRFLDYRFSNLFLHSFSFVFFSPFGSSQIILFGVLVLQFCFHFKI